MEEVEMTLKMPAYYVYTVDDNVQNAFWLKIGAAFPHKDKKGFTVALSALPTDAKLILRECNSELERNDEEGLTNFQQRKRAQ